MGGANDPPLATAEDRNGLVSGEKPWNRGVLRRKEPSASSGNGRRRRRRDLWSACATGSSGLPDRTHHVAPLPPTPAAHLGATQEGDAPQPRLRTERASAAAPDRFAGRRCPRRRSEGRFGDRRNARRRGDGFGRQTLRREEARTFATSGSLRCPGEARATASAARERWDPPLLGGGHARAEGFGPRSVRLSPTSLRRRGCKARARRSTSNGRKAMAAVMRNGC